MKYQFIITGFTYLFLCVTSTSISNWVKFAARNVKVSQGLQVCNCWHINVNVEISCTYVYDLSAY
jgi:hypothetical protein